jgi:hypothetical protein
MIPIKNITGRLGNQMFQFAFLYAYALEHGVDKYFQDPKWFEAHKDKILAEYQIGLNGRDRIDMVAIHVRRGDYVGHDFYVDLMETPYYEDAMNKFPDADFLVFSDDIEWCKDQEIFKECEFSEGRTEVEDMNLMACCVGHIIANSSFSWWGAYISPSTQKVVAPSVEHWYTDGEERTVCPDNWLRI